MRLRIVFFVVLLAGKFACQAQGIPAVGYQAVEEYLRRGQLQGDFHSSYSFCKRPLSFIKNDSSANNPMKYWHEGYMLYNKADLGFFILPVVSGFQNSSAVPYGQNDGAILPAAGFQSLASAGFRAVYKGLSLELRPEFLYAQNLKYKGFPEVHYKIVWMWRYIWWNRIDQPEWINSVDISKILPGQSTLKYAIGNVSAGVSSQSLWWGPAKRNSMIMSNNARGFAHLFVGTEAPVETPIGGIEGQLIVGRLENSGRKPTSFGDTLYFLAPLYFQKRDEWRYLSGLTISWQPKWIKGLFIGYSKTKQLYHSDLQYFGDYFPIFNRKESAFDAVNIEQSPSSQQSSAFVRWVFENGLAEVYAEYGSHGAPRRLRAWLEEPERNRGYTFGISKLFPLKSGKFIQFQSEITQLQQPQRKGILNAQSWYISDAVRHGYTHHGEIVGAGIGPGGNSQFMDISWINRLNKLGIQLERITHNNDWAIYTFSGTGDYRRHWIDYTAGAHIDWRVSKLLLSAKAIYVRSINYQWELVSDPKLPWFRNGRDITNFYLGISGIFSL